MLTTAAGNFTDSGTLDVAKGSTLTVGGTGNSYNQTAGKTTIDGTLAGISSATVTGGTILGAGSVNGNLSVGNASGTAATINVGDSGVAGLLSITGKYTQLATGAMTGTINGTTAGTGYSQLKVTGAAALAGTINFTVATAFQASLTLGEKFTVLSASSVTGTFSNTTIAINSTFEFTVSYTSTGVVLTVASTPSQHGTAQTATASAKPAVAVVVRNPVKSKSPVVVEWSAAGKCRGETCSQQTASASCGGRVGAFQRKAGERVCAERPAQLGTDSCGPCLAGSDGAAAADGEREPGPQPARAGPVADAGEPSDRDSADRQGRYVEHSTRTGPHPVSDAPADGALDWRATELVTEALQSVGESDVRACHVHDGAPNQQRSGCSRRRNVQNVQHLS